MEGGVDKYTGETLAAIARRATNAAKQDAALVSNGMATDGSSVTEKGFVERIDTVKTGGKCWSVDEERKLMGDVKTKA
jgi:hypothetical protein